MSTEQLRADFEAWARTDGHDDFERFGEGYAHPELREAWRGYQAGRAALQSQNKEAMRVIETARRAMDNSTECGDRFGGIALSSDDAAALSLSLDEYDHARRVEEEQE